MSTQIVEIDGYPLGGSVFLRVCVGGIAADITEPTFAELFPHRIAENLSYRLRDSIVGPYLTVDHGGSVLLIEGADVVEVASQDEGLDAIEYDVPDGSRLNQQLTAIRAPGGGGASSGTAGDPDQQVLGHLANMIGALSQGSQADETLLQGVLSAHRTLMQGTTAFLTGTPMPIEPNPGTGGAVVTDADTTTGLLNSLAQTNVGMMRALGSMADARGEQVGAAADKEAEAKKGTPGGNPGTQSGGGTGTPPTGSGGGGSGSPSDATQPGDGQGRPAASGQLMARPAGSKEPLQPWEPATKIVDYTINGMVISLAQYADGTWCMARQKLAVELHHDDGTVEVVPRTTVYDIPIDKNKWDAYIAELQAQAAPKDPPPEESTSTVLKVISTILDMTPFVGNVKMGLEALIGHDLVTWETLDAGTRALYAVCVLMATPIGAKLMKGLGAGVRSVLGTTEKAIARGEALTARQIANLRKLEDAVAEARAIKCTGEEVKAAESALGKEVAETGRVVPEPVCFVAGTPVMLDDGTLRAIDRLAVGDAVASARGAAHEVLASDVVGAPVTRVFVRQVESDVLTLMFLADGEVEELTATGAHPFGTADGYVAARDLCPGDRIFTTAGGSASLLGARVHRHAGPVFNLEVAEHHNYHVGRLGLLVHNGCEAITQGHVEEAIDNGLVEGMERKTYNGQTLSEPGYGSQRPINMGRQQINDMVSQARTNMRRVRDAARKGKATLEEVETAERAYKDMVTARSNMTFPDVVVTEGNRTLAIELKTPKEGQSLFEFFNARYKQGRITVQMPESFVDEMGTRVARMPTDVDQVLVVDLRFCDKAYMGKTAAEMEAHLAGRAQELSSVLSTGAYEGRGVGDVFKEIRFVVGNEGAAQMSHSFPFAVAH